MNDYTKEASLDSIEDNLMHLIVDFLDSESVKLDEAIGGFSDPESRDNSELHIRMTKAAMSEYRKTVLHQ